MPTLTFAQTGMIPGSSFYAGDSAIPKDTTSPATTPRAFGDVPADPWNIGSDNGTGWNNGWTSDPANGTDPYSLGWGGGTGFTTLSPFDDLAAYAIQMAGVLTFPYYQSISDLRSKNSFENDDQIAEAIIKDAIKSAGGWGAINSVIYTLGTLVQPKLNPGGGSAGWAFGGLVATLGHDFYQVFKTQSTMILKLAALYGELPNNPQERVDLLKTSFAVAAGIGGAVTNGQIFLAKMIEKQLGVEAAIAAQAGTTLLAQEVFANTVATGATNALSKEVLAKAIPKGIQEIAVREITIEATSLAAANGIVQAAARDGLQVTITKAAGNRWIAALKSDGAKKLGAGLLAGAVAAFLSYQANALSTKWLAKDIKSFFKASREIREAKAIRYVKTNPLMRKTLWMILTRDVFNRVPDKNVQLRYAQVVASEVPLVKNKMVDEFADVVTNFNNTTQSMCVSATTPKPTVRTDLDKVIGEKTVVLSDDFGKPTPIEECNKKDVKTFSVAIDKNLVAINKKFKINTDAKLYLMKLIVAGMYTKGSLSEEDYTSLETIAILLGLQAPPNVQVAHNDRRLDDIARYLGLLTEMDKAVYDREMLLARADAIKSSSDVKKQSALKKVEKWGPAGQIILEDFETQAPVMRIIEDSFNQKSISTETAKKIEEISKERASEALKN